MRKFRNYKVWQRGMDFVEVVYRASANFPQDERFGLTSQLRRAVVSVPMNIAEGAGSSTDKEFAKFVGYSLHSTYEVMTAIELAERLGFFASEVKDGLLDEADQIAAMLASLKKKLGGSYNKVAEDVTGYDIDVETHDLRLETRS